jgi:plasmid stability protein
MPTLYVENVPDAVYAALRGRARASGHSISAEALALLKQNAPTPNELARRRALLDRALRLQARRAGAFGPSSEEIQREDRFR